MRAEALLLVGSALAMATAAAAGRTVIDMPAPRGHPVQTVSAGESRGADLGAVALHRYAAGRSVPLYGYPSAPMYRPCYGYGYGYGFGYGLGYGYGYPIGFGFGHHRHLGGFRRSGFRHGAWR